MMFPFHIQLIIPSEHYSPHAIAKPYPHSATPPHLGNQLMGEIPMLWELPVSREAVKSKYNKLQQREQSRRLLREGLRSYPQPLPAKNISVIVSR
jgi:hypothetical protein